MNKIANRQVICEVLLEHAAKDRDITVLCSDSRGSASLAPFAEKFPAQFVEMGIAEQSLVSTAAGMARVGKKAFAASPACFLPTRSMEQVKVDVAYSHTNVKLIGISGGISYGALGMTHHSAQDIAALASIPGLRVYLPSDRHLTRALMEALLKDSEPAYIRTGRNPVEDVYTAETLDFALDRAVTVREGGDVAIIACGELVRPALDAAALLEKRGISARVLDMYCVKPIDRAAVLRAAAETKGIVTVEEHGKIGGMGAMVSQITAESCPVRVKNLALPDEPAVAGSSQEVFAWYGLDAAHIADAAAELVAL